MKFSVLCNLKIVMRILLFSASSDYIIIFLSPQGDSESFVESNRISAAVVGNLERKILDIKVNRGCSKVCRSKVDLKVRKMN